MTPPSPRPTGPATSAAVSGFDRFLRSVERPAIRIAELGEELHPRAVEHVARAMASLSRDWQRLPEADWPAEFWRRLHRRLSASRGNAAARAFGRLEPADEETGDGDPDPLSSPDSMAHLEAALRALSSPQRLAFLLRVWEELDLPTVARALELPAADAKSELFHALQRLHARLAPGALDRQWVLRCRELLDAWALRIEPASLAPLAVVRRALGQPPPPVRLAADRSWVRKLGLVALLAGAAVLGWRGLAAWKAQPAAPVAAVQPLAADDPPEPVVELAPVAAPDYDLLADDEQFALLQDLDFYAWYAREHGTHD